MALTEAREESGISEVAPVSVEIFDIDIHVIPDRGTVPEHLHYDVRYLMQAGSSKIVISSESLDLAWVPRRDLSTYTTEESMLRMSRKWLLMNPDLSI